MPKIIKIKTCTNEICTWFKLEMTRHIGLVIDWHCRNVKIFVLKILCVIRTTAIMCPVCPVCPVMFSGHQLFEKGSSSVL